MWFVSVLHHPTDLNLALIIGLAALGLLLLLLLLILLIIALRRRRTSKATEAYDAQASSTSTVSVNLTPSNSTCSRNSDESLDSDDKEPQPSAALPLQLHVTLTLPKPPPKQQQQQLEPVTPTFPVVYSQPETEPEVVATSHDDVREGEAAYGVGTDRPSWTQSMPSVVTLSNSDLSKVPPMVVKKTAKTESVARLTLRRRMSVDSADISAKLSSAEPLPGIGPERPRPAGPNGRYVYIPPKLHIEPRGWAPASHAVPLAVKRTWGRAKAKEAAERERQLSDDMDPSITLSNLSLCDDDIDMFSRVNV